MERDSSGVRRQARIVALVRALAAGGHHIPPRERVKAQGEPVAPAADAAAEPAAQGEPQGKGAKAQSGHSSRARGAKKPAAPKTSGAAMEPDLAARGIERVKPTTSKEA